MPSIHRLATVAGVAQALQLAGASRIAVYFADSATSANRSEAGWQDALNYAVASRLPLLMICSAPASAIAAGKPDSLTWPNISKLGKRLKLPVLSVDGVDAPALYRVMQESVLRARTGGGPAVLWCLQPDRNSPQADPIRHMRAYLAQRKLLPPARR